MNIMGCQQLAYWFSIFIYDFLIYNLTLILFFTMVYVVYDYKFFLVILSLLNLNIIKKEN